MHLVFGYYTCQVVRRRDNDLHSSITKTVLAGEFSDQATITMSYSNRGFDTNHDPHDKGAELEDKMSQSSSTSTLPPPDYNRIVQNSPSISVIGSGDFGRALAGRLAQSGCRVTIASRDGGARNG